MKHLELKLSTRGKLLKLEKATASRTVGIYSIAHKGSTYS